MFDNDETELALFEFLDQLKVYEETEYAICSYKHVFPLTFQVTSFKAYCISTLVDWNHCYKHFIISDNTWARATSSLQSSWTHPSPLVCCIVCVCVCETVPVFLNEILAWETDRWTTSVQLTIHLLQHSHHILSQRLSTIQKNMVSLGVFNVYLNLCHWLTEKRRLSDHKNRKCKCP